MNILLIGDSCLDHYKYVRTTRSSVEAPIPIYDEVYGIISEGMVHNVKSMLHSLGSDVFLLHKTCERKTRFMDIDTGNQLFRCDSKVLRFNRFKLPTILHGYDAIVISDYNKGFLTYEDIELIIKKAPCPVFLDTKKRDLARFEGAILKINKLEWDSRESEPTNVVITLGSAGALYNSVVYPVKPIDVVDVCGAGDIFLAALAVRYIETRSMSESIDFANKAARVSVAHARTYIPTRTEICASL